MLNEVEQIRALAENRPAVYRMTDAMGRIIYVGKAKRLRTRPSACTSRGQQAASFDP